MIMITDNNDTDKRWSQSMVQSICITISLSGPQWASLTRRQLFWILIILIVITREYGWIWTSANISPLSWSSNPSGPGGLTLALLILRKQIRAKFWPFEKHDMSTVYNGLMDIPCWWNHQWTLKILLYHLRREHKTKRFPSLSGKIVFQLRACLEILEKCSDWSIMWRVPLQIYKSRSKSMVYGCEACVIHRLPKKLNIYEHHEHLTSSECKTISMQLHHLPTMACNAYVCTVCAVLATYTCISLYIFVYHHIPSLGYSAINRYLHHQLSILPRFLRP